ncbi:MAG: hypothetical protein ACYC1M_01070 [Armatimonadota bacterium]
MTRQNSVIQLASILLAGMALTGGVQAQANRVNTPFKTVTDTLQSAYVVKTTRSAVDMTPIKNYQRSMARAVAPTIARLRAKRMLPGTMPFAVDTLVAQLSSGKLVRTAATRSTSLSFVVPTTGTGAWTAEQAAFIKSVADQAVIELTSICGAPLNGGTITILNDDANISDRNAVAGGIYNVSSGQFFFPVYNSEVSVIANMTHLVAHAMRGADILAYDSWEEGIARATGQIAAPRVAQALGRSTSVVDALRRESNYHALPFYDLMNQPSLANNSFIPKSQLTTPIESGSIGGIWLPRYMMAGSAWMKVYIDDPLFYKNFMQAYKTAGGAAIAGDVPKLRQVLKQVITTIEGQPVDTWFDKQYVLDNSIRVGRKLYAYNVPIRTASGTDSSIFIDLMYVDTATDGDETPVSGFSYPQYFDFEEVNIFPGSQYESVEVYQGEGAFSPSFQNDFLGGAQRVRMILPVGMESVELPYAFGQSGSLTSPKTLYGVVDGLTTGTIEVSSAVGTISGSVVRGSFGLVLPTGSFDTPRAYQITIKNSSGITVGTRQVNLGYSEGVLYINLNSAEITVNKPYSAGLKMFSIPMSFRQADNARVLGVPALGFKLARWIQPNKAYSLYPAIDSFAPGRAFWMKPDTNFTAILTGVSTPMDRDALFSAVFGWNMVGLPVDRTVSLSELQVQVKDQTPVSFATAVTQGVVGNSFLKYNSGYEPILSTGSLSPWEGYWIRVRQSEGVTFIVPPSSSAVAAVSSRTMAPYAAAADGWRTAIQVQAGSLQTKVWIGQSKTATTRYDLAFDAESGPADPSGLNAQITATQPLLQDIQPVVNKSAWRVQISGATPRSVITLSLSDLAAVRRLGRIVVTDQNSLFSQLLTGGWPIKIKTDANGRAYMVVQYQRMVF